MSANARTWFYNEPEHRPYYIEERVNSNLWATRFGSIYLDCVRAEPPFRMEGSWNGIAVSIEWESNKWLKLVSDKEDNTLIMGFARVLHLTPTLTFTDRDGMSITEWWRTEPEKRMQEVQGNPSYSGIKTYKR